MSSVRSISFNYNDFTVADLNETDIVFKNKKRHQGLRYTLIRQTANGQEYKTVIFQDLFNHLQMLTKKTVEDERTAEKSKPYIKALNEIKDFIPKLEAAEEASRESYAKQGFLFKICTIICRIFGKTPLKGTHANRLTTFKGEIDKHISNMKEGYNLEIYAKIESIIDKNKHKKKIFINYHRKFPKASQNELNSVLMILNDKGKLEGFTIFKNQIRIDLPDLKVYAEIEAFINANMDKGEIHIDYNKKFPAVSVNELHCILSALENIGKLVDYDVYEEHIVIKLIKKDIF